MPTQAAQSPRPLRKKFCLKDAAPGPLFHLKGNADLFRLAALLH